MSAFKNILVATDFGPAARRATDVACDLAEQSHADVTLLHVWTVPLPAYSERITLPLEEMEQAAREALERDAACVRSRCPHVKTLLLPGLAWRAVSEAIEEHGFDLVVIGRSCLRAHASAAARHASASVAVKIPRTAPRSTTTAHPYVRAAMIRATSRSESSG